MLAILQNADRLLGESREPKIHVTRIRQVLARPPANFGIDAERSRRGPRRPVTASRQTLRGPAVSTRNPENPEAFAPPESAPISAEFPRLHEPLNPKGSTFCRNLKSPPERGFPASALARDEDPPCFRQISLPHSRGGASTERRGIPVTSSAMLSVHSRRPVFLHCLMLR